MSTRNIVAPVYIDVCDICDLSSTNRPKPADWIHLVVYIGRNYGIDARGGSEVHLDVCAECWAEVPHTGGVKVDRFALLRAAVEKSRGGA